MDHRQLPRHRRPAKFDDGWLRTGDIGVITPDGYLTLTDRAKDVIKSGGEWISSVELENHLMAHPAVIEAAVIAVADERWGERPKAFVTLKPGHQTSEREIIDFCKQHIAHFKAPAAVEFGDLPKTSTGKVQKFVLREKEWKGQAKRIN